MLEVESPSGPARVYLHGVDRPRAWLLLGHGAGGGVEAPDLVATREAALQERVGVGLVEQPYQVNGRRSPAPANQLDAAWEAVVSRLGERELHGLPLLVGGRSSGARVACRTSATTDAIAVVCLAFRFSHLDVWERRRHRTGLWNSTPLRFRLSSCRECATRSASRQAARSAPWLRCKETTA
jgi:predicted alpha/beta-hydrolase family hydrolase